jgi:hypothetical protein
MTIISGQPGNQCRYSRAASSVAWSKRMIRDIDLSTLSLRDSFWRSDGSELFHRNHCPCRNFILHSRNAVGVKQRNLQSLRHKMLLDADAFGCAESSFHDFRTAQPAARAVLVSVSISTPAKASHSPGEAPLTMAFLHAMSYSRVQCNESFQKLDLS